MITNDTVEIYFQMHNLMFHFYLMLIYHLLLLLFFYLLNVRENITISLFSKIVTESREKLMTSFLRKKYLNLSEQYNKNASNI